ncbi:MAG: hypothetical protein RIQ99_2167 [Pseudomonadota bacterium]
MQLFIRHTTHYRFDQPIAHGLQQLRLKPRSGPGQSVIDWRMTLGGAQVEVEYEDQNGNRTVRGKSKLRIVQGLSGRIAASCRSGSIAIRLS